MNPIRLLIADDHTLFREGVSALLGTVPELEMVGEAASGDEVVTLAESLQPDVILMDVLMPGLNGIEATRRITEVRPEVGVIVVTMLEGDDSVFAAMQAGARGYILKGADKGEMLRAIQAVARGEALFGPSVAARLMRFFRAAESENSPEVARPVFPELTDREREILVLVAQGLNNAEIAARLVLSPKTISNHVSNILSKLQVTDRTQALLRAREAGLK